MKYRILFMAICFMCIWSCTHENNEKPINMEVLGKVNQLMTDGQYEAAQEAIGEIHKTYPNIENDEVQYYILCFESEIFYYNAIFSLGAENASEAISFCKLKFPNDSNLIGNAWNLRGINAENFLPIPEVIEIYRQAEFFLTNHSNPLLSYRYHVLSNLGQLYAKSNHKKEGLKLLRSSNQLCQQEKAFRTLCINHITLSRLFSDSGLLSNAQSHYDSAKYYYQKDKREDLELFLINQKAHLLFKENKKEDAKKLLKQSFDNSLSEDAYSMGLVDFYKESSKLLTEMGYFGFAEEVSLALIRIQDQTLQKEFVIKERIISRHYKNKETINSQRLEQKAAAETLKNQRNTFILLTSLLLASLLLVLFWIFYFIQRRKLEKMGAMVEAILSERDRISRDFHDGIAPNLSTIKLISEAAIQNPNKSDHLLRMPDLVDQTIVEIRRMINELSPRNIVEYGLDLAVSVLVENLQSAQNIHFSLKSEIVNKRYNAEIELNVYRVMQEAINNAIKHSNSKVISIEMYETNKSLITIVSDHGCHNGDGFSENERGNGLHNMRMRIDLIKGKLEIKNERNRGTKVTLSIPID